MLNDLSLHLTKNQFTFQKLIQINYNLMRFKNEVLKKYLTENFYIHQELNNKYDEIVNLIYE